jgi:deoxyribodipyrimidine photo-lyase
MQASQRVRENPAFSFACSEADRLGKPLLVFFGVCASFPRAGRRQYRFMLEGLRVVRDSLRQNGIRFMLSLEGPVQGLALIGHLAALVVTDLSYGKTERRWRAEAADLLACQMIQVESNVVVPVATASSKEEYSAATLRRKIEPMISWFSREESPLPCHTGGPDVGPEGAEDMLDDIDALMDRLGIGGEALPLRWITGGEAQAVQRLDLFIERHLDGYADHHNDPADPFVSFLSPYLHFGHISPSLVCRMVGATGSPGVPAFLEQLVVRRELAVNFTWYNPLHDSYDGLPAWALRSLGEHDSDPRPYRYGFGDLLAARTHDPYWNAAQRELVHRGTMHGYMRMYWGKKILEWSSAPRMAFDTALLLNDTYQVDGRDPNGYAGVAWCFGKHDRPWVERPVFGNIRYMNDNGLRRKFDMDRYVKRIDALVTQEGSVE